MDQRIVDSMFDPFFTTKSKGEGTGLGMAMIYGMMEQHGGRVEVESEVGVGTTLRLLFPLVDDETGQILVSGMGELQLDVLKNRMVRDFSVDAVVGLVGCGPDLGRLRGGAGGALFVRRTRESDRRGPGIGRVVEHDRCETNSTIRRI